MSIGQFHAKDNMGSPFIKVDSAQSGEVGPQLQQQFKVLVSYLSLNMAFRSPELCRWPLNRAEGFDCRNFSVRTLYSHIIQIQHMQCGFASLESTHLREDHTCPTGLSIATS